MKLSTCHSRAMPMDSMTTRIGPLQPTRNFLTTTRDDNSNYQEMRPSRSQSVPTQHNSSPRDSQRGMDAFSNDRTNYGHNYIGLQPTEEANKHHAKSEREAERRPSRSQSVASQHHPSSRKCLRGADSFCGEHKTNNPHNYIGLQPRDTHQESICDDESRMNRPCCSNRARSNPIQDSYNEMPSYKPSCSQSPERQGDSCSSRWSQQQRPQRQHRQQQFPLQQQHQRQCQQTSCGTQDWSRRGEDSFDSFEPDLNSTMIDTGVTSQRSCYGLLRQQQQQQQQQPYAACCTQSRQPPPAACSTQFEQPQRAQTSSELTCPAQHQQYHTMAEDTSYMMLPPARSARPSSFRQVGSCNTNNVTFVDQCQDPEPACRSVAASNDWSASSPCCSSTKSTSCQTTLGPPVDYSSREDSVESFESVDSCSKAAPSTSAYTPFSRAPPFIEMSQEEHYKQRTNNLLFHTLVLDQSCPGVIQSSLDGQQDFNKLALDIAYGRNVPDKPHPVDPISMLEAIKMRIDYERTEISKKCPPQVKASEPDSHSDGHKKKAKGKSKRSDQPKIHEIDRHFHSKNRSEVNNGVRAFLKAEDEYDANGGNLRTDFAADIRSHSSNFFGLSIMMKVYNATTRPNN